MNECMCIFTIRKFIVNLHNVYVQYVCMYVCMYVCVCTVCMVYLPPTVAGIDERSSQPNDPPRDASACSQIASAMDCTPT